MSVWNEIRVIGVVKADPPFTQKTRLNAFGKY